MFLKPPPGVAAPAAGLARGAWLLIGLALLAPFVLYFGTIRSIVSIWNSSETFAHGYVILPICLWLVWRRRENFAAFPATPYWPALLLLAAAGAAWLAARMGEVNVVMQYAVAAMIPLTALALFGRRLAGSLAFPLLFVLFAVPFGEIFVAPLIEFTANFTVWAVQMTGIPVLRSGSHFELPTGSWAVVEACSGVRYLISSVTLGCLYAYLTYRSTARRLMFIALAVVVPVVANGLRAFMIVMIGHFSGMTLAVGVDHLIYGWLFFGLVMFIMFWIGGFWREDAAAPAPAQVAPLAQAAPAPARRAGTARIGAMAAAVIALGALWPAFASYNDHANLNPHPVRLELAGLSWPAAPAVSDWRAHYMAPDAGVTGAYRLGDARTVELQVLYYRNQNHAKALISSLNRLAGYNDAWHELGSTLRTENAGPRSIAVREATLQGPTGKLLVWSTLWVDGHYTASNVAGKLWQARAKLLFHGDDGAFVALAAPYLDGADGAQAARRSLRAFLAANGGAIDSALAAAQDH